MVTYNLLHLMVQFTQKEGLDAILKAKPKINLYLKLHKNKGRVLKIKLILISSLILTHSLFHRRIFRQVLLIFRKLTQTYILHLLRIFQAPHLLTQQTLLRLSLISYLLSLLIRARVLLVYRPQVVQSPCFHQ